MFELMNALETARNIDNKFLRWCMVKYTKFRLKNIFFKKFDTNNIVLDYNLINEISRFHACVDYDIWMNSNAPNMYYVDIDKSMMGIQYYNFKLIIQFFSNHKDYCVLIRNNKNGNKEITYHPGIRLDEWMPIREIFFISIYNYCVAYTYGQDSDLYINDKSHIGYLEDMF